MSELARFSVYVHLTATTKPDDILETVKIELKAAASSDEESKESPDTILTLTGKVKEHLDTVRNDGNKEYAIEGLSTEFGGEQLMF